MTVLEKIHRESELQEKLHRLDLRERQITASMENDIHKYGEFQCDWWGGLRAIAIERQELTPKDKVE